MISELKKSGHDVKLAVSGAHLSDHHSNTYKRIIDDGFEICFWPKHIGQKDINDMILNGLSANVVEQTINENKFSGLSAKMALSDWSKVSG